MSHPDRPIILATRGSPLATAQTNAVLAQCRSAHPGLSFEIKIIRTTGDKLQTASMAQDSPALPKGLFTKELETALLNGEADMAVHSLKDLPTELPDGLVLGAVGIRADARDVLIYRRAAHPAHPSTFGSHGPGSDSGDPGAGRGFPANLILADLPVGATIATSSTRRREQLLERRPDLKTVEVRGNVGTRLQKLAKTATLDATILAAAGLARLGYRVTVGGELICEEAALAANPKLAIPPGLLAVFLPIDEMLPCVGQGAVGIEIRANDSRIEPVCRCLDHPPTRHCVTAERAFLRAMGGGCQSPVAAYAETSSQGLFLRAVSYRSGTARRSATRGSTNDAEPLGKQLAQELSEPAPQNQFTPSRI